MCSMRIRNQHHDTDAVNDTIDDRDLIAFINEARDPAEIDRITAIARARRRARRRLADVGATPTPTPQPSRRRTHLLGRGLGFRH